MRPISAPRRGSRRRAPDRVRVLEQRRECLDERLIRNVVALVAPTGDDDGALTMCEPGEARDETGLADARLAGDEDDALLAVTGLLPCVAQHLQFVLAADELLVATRQERGQGSDGVGCGGRVAWRGLAATEPDAMDPLRATAPGEVARAEIDERDPVSEVVAHDLRGRVGDEHLSCTREPSQPCGAVHLRSVVVARPLDRFARADRGANLDRCRERPALLQKSRVATRSRPAPRRLRA